MNFAGRLLQKAYCGAPRKDLIPRTGKWPCVLFQKQMVLGRYHGGISLGRQRRRSVSSSLFSRRRILMYVKGQKKNNEWDRNLSGKKNARVVGVVIVVENHLPDG
jgi:hypothetical protein